MPTCLFRADASASVGAGHIIRCLSLAYAMARLGWRCRFAVNSEAPSIVPSLQNVPFGLDFLDTAGRLPVELIKQGFELLIVDHYGLDAQYERWARHWASGIVVIDELADRPHDCDVLLDQTLYRTEATYKNCVGANTHFLLGAKFSLLREQFKTAREIALEYRESRKGELEHIIISMGSTDPSNASSWLLEAIIPELFDRRVTVVLGAGAPHVGSVEAIAERSGTGVQVRRDVFDMATLMSDVDLAVAAAGSASYERCCLGIPTLIITTGKDQEPNAYALAEAGAAIYLGRNEDVTLAEVQKAVRTVRDRPYDLRAMQKAASRVCDGDGAIRSARAITEIVSSRVSHRPE